MEFVLIFGVGLLVCVGLVGIGWMLHDLFNKKY